MFRFHNNKLPNALKNIFVSNEEIHMYGTRNRKTPHLYVKRDTCYNQSFMYQAPTLWLKIPTNIREFKTCTIIVKKVKELGLLSE